MWIILQLFLGLLFLLISLVIFSLPGFGVLKFFRFKLENIIEKYCIATVLGIVIFTLVAYVLAFLHLRVLMYLFIPVGIFIAYVYRKNLLRFKIDVYKSDLILFLIVLIIGCIGMVLVNALSGINNGQGITFYSSHGHDGVWHLSLMENLQKDEFPFQNPEYYGQRLQNYHFFVDLFMSEIVRLFPFFSSLDVYFRFVPILFSLLLGLASFIFVRKWANSISAGIWAMFMVYFCGSFGYLLTLPRNHNIFGESIFWVSQTQSVLGNPPHAAAFIILTVFLFCFLIFLRTRERNWFFISAFLGGVVIEFKVYAGVLILGGLFVLGIYELIFKRKIGVGLLFILTLLISLVIYLPNSNNSQEFLIWQPWWFIRTMVVAPDRLNMLDWELKRQTYIAEDNLKRVIQLEVYAFLIFLFGNLGVRFVGFITIFKQLKSNIFKHSFEMFFLIITTAAFFIPVFFLQKGVAWNAIQFNQYFLLLFGFLAALALKDIVALIKPKILKTIFIGLVVLLAIPTQIGLLWLFYTSPPLSIISNDELKVLDFVKNNTDENDVILVAPFDRFKAEGYSAPIPIYTWYDTGYVSAFSKRPTLVSDQEQVTIMGYQVEDLLRERQLVFESKDPEEVNDFLKKYKIDLVYLSGKQQFNVPIEWLNLKPLFEQGDTKVYKVE